MQDEQFEWDDSKADSNQRKHGVSFYEARKIWFDPRYCRVKLCDLPEDRWIAIGMTDRGRLLSAIFTYRGDNPERIRIISARKATKMEVDAYHA